MDKETKDAIKEAKELAGIKEQNNDLKTFIFDENEVIQTRVFSSHLLSQNAFGFGKLLPRTEDIIKKGEVIGQHQVWRPVIITSDKRGLVVSKWLENEYKISYEAIPEEMRLRWELKDIDNYLHHSVENIDGTKLFEDIKKQYEHYLFFREKTWYSVHSLWDIGTYLHQLFSAYPILEQRGLSGTAKTKTMIVSSYISLNATDIMTNPSEATLFRETENMRPSKYIDEAEKLFKQTKEGLEADNRVELINSSFSRNGVVPRQEKAFGKYITKWYHVYSPTMISSINGLYGATENRAITHIHTKASDSDLRGERDPEDDIKDSKWKEIRNRCYLWTLQNWKQVYDSYLNFNVQTALKKRDLQLWKPLLVIARIIDDKVLLPEIIAFAEKLSRQRKNDSINEGSLDYKLLDCLNQLLLCASSERIYVNALREKLNSIYRLYEPADIGYNKTVSTHLDKLGFKELRDKDMYGSYYELTKRLFDEIISPQTNSFSSEPSYSSYSNINKKEKNDECMTNSDELIDKDMMNMTQKMNMTDNTDNNNIKTEKVE